MKVTKDLLKYEYSWKAVPGDNPAVTKPDRPRFSREEGYEVLPMIQRVVDELRLTDPKDIHVLEDFIKSLPSDYQGREKVFGHLKAKMEIHRMSLARMGGMLLKKK